MSKQLGDAGEWYALSQFGFAGCAAAKMPDNWRAYDLYLDCDGHPFRVSVKTRTQTEKWASAPWFNFSSKSQCDILVCVLRTAEKLRAWVLPFAEAESVSHKPSTAASDQDSRDLYLRTLESELARYEDYWRLPFGILKFCSIPQPPSSPSYEEMMRAAKEELRQRAP